MQVLLALFQSAALLCLLELRLSTKKMGLLVFSYRHPQQFLTCSWLQDWLVCSETGEGGLLLCAVEVRLRVPSFDFKNGLFGSLSEAGI